LASLDCMKYFAVIPARWDSSRFPGKPLANVLGKPMIQRVWERASQSGLFQKVIIATDDQRILEAALLFKAEVILTSSSHLSGTDRCAEVVQIKSSEINNDDVIFNIQGDEPFIDRSALKTLVDVFVNNDIQIATLIKKITQSDLIHRPEIVKVVCDSLGRALYFSRSAIPFQRDIADSMFDFYQHVGIYAYKASVLKQLASLSEAPLEKTEKLEQLRWLYNGFSIQTAITHSETHAVDTPNDLIEIENWALKTGQII